MKKLIRVTSVSFELAVLEYLKELRVRDDRDRSYTVNHFIREHARMHGRVLRPARLLIPSPAGQGPLSILGLPEEGG